MYILGSVSEVSSSCLFQNRKIEYHLPDHMHVLEYVVSTSVFYFVLDGSADDKP